MERDVRVGRGFFLLRGIPVERYTDKEVFLLKWGDMLGHVFDHGNEVPTAVRTRGYQTSADPISANASRRQRQAHGRCPSVS